MVSSAGDRDDFTLLFFRLCGNHHSSMAAKPNSPSLDFSPHLKRAFKDRCIERGHSMADAIAGLVGGWMAGRYTVPTPPAAPRQTIYVPSRAYAQLRDRCRAGERRVPMQRVLEELIAAWLEGRFRWPPPGGDQ